MNSPFSFLMEEALLIASAEGLVPASLHRTANNPAPLSASPTCMVKQIDHTKSIRDKYRRHHRQPNRHDGNDSAEEKYALIPITIDHLGRLGYRASLPWHARPHIPTNRTT
jgi:hypothetical protein